MNYNFRSGVQHDYKHTIIIGAVGLVIIGMFLGAGISGLFRKSQSGENTTVTRVTKQAPAEETASSPAASSANQSAALSEANTTASGNTSITSSNKSTPSNSSGTATNTNQTATSSTPQPSSSTPVGGRGGGGSSAPSDSNGSSSCACGGVTDTVDTLVNIADDTTQGLTGGLKALGL